MVFGLDLTTMQLLAISGVAVVTAIYAYFMAQGGIPSLGLSTKDLQLVA